MKDNLNIIEKYIHELELNLSPHNLYAPIHYTLNQGGKRIRPQLCLLSANLFGGDTKQAIYPAIAFELLHNFTLIHDDIMDNAPLRRGKETVYKKWNTNIAILSGDTLFAKAYQCLLNYQGKGICSLLSLLTQTAIGICEGQQLDLDFESEEIVTIEQYISMIRLKTAIMLAACLKAGAILSDATEQEQQLIYDFGIKTGLAFQIQDDLLDVYADVNKFGKSTGGDIVENKKTYMSLKAMNLAQNDDLQQLRYYFSSLDFDREEKFYKVKVIYDKYKIKEHACKLINQYYDEAICCLQQINVQASSKQTLLDFIRQLVNRDY
ncbi:MAG: polyprenyl synthetase family protein [Bacteroidales bacterium]|jgi:geranylgeranyl diphosphate synthase type II|nr:polyprenyl synthetase family protein [Bacteroidales bacterium]